jgi:hypothetical protein
MKRILLYTFSWMICLTSCSSKEEQIKEVVHKWNKLHNTHNAIEFKEIYAPDVLFYGRQTSMESCYAKKKAFLTSEFRQDIISPISINYYSTGVIKCDFTKRTKYRKEKVREYYCYLLLKKEGSKYLITGESDLLSDQRRNTNLQLGNKIASPSRGIGIYITVLILLIIAGIVYRVRKKRMKEVNEWEIFKEQYKAPNESEKPIIIKQIGDVSIDENLASKIKAAVVEEMKNYFPVDSPGEKGFLFEKFIVTKFDQTYFKLNEWRSDKYHQEIYAASNKLPDLEYDFKTSKYDCKVAIECKWRANFNGKKIEIAREDQLQNYWQYSVNRKIPVFIILGVGGKPEAPEDLYIMRLDEIQGPILYRNQLMKFRRHPQKGSFFFNAETMILV